MNWRATSQDAFAVFDLTRTIVRMIMLIDSYGNNNRDVDTFHITSVDVTWTDQTRPNHRASREDAVGKNEIFD